MKNWLVKLSAFATAFAIMAVKIIMDGWVLSIVWKWFFVSTLNLPIINIPQAMGIALVVGFLTKALGGPLTESVGQTLKRAFARPFVVLLIGWLITLFM